MPTHENKVHTIILKLDDESLDVVQTAIAQYIISCKRIRLQDPLSAAEWHRKGSIANGLYNATMVNVESDNA